MAPDVSETLSCHQISPSAAEGTARMAGERLIPSAQLQLRKPEGEPWENLGGFNPKTLLRRRLFPHPPCRPAGGLSTTGTKESHPWDARGHPGRSGGRAGGGAVPVCAAGASPGRCCRAAADTLPFPPGCGQGFCRWVSSVPRARRERSTPPRHACARP